MWNIHPDIYDNQESKYIEWQDIACSALCSHNNIFVLNNDLGVDKKHEWIIKNKELGCDIWHTGFVLKDHN